MKLFRVDMTSEGKGALAALLSLLWNQAGYTGVNPRTGDKRGIRFVAFREPKHQLDEGEKRLVFFWGKNPSATDVTELPVTLDAEGAFMLASTWLDEVDYGPEDDTDGHCNKGWRVYNERFHHVDNDAYGFIAISPAWIVYDK